MEEEEEMKDRKKMEMIREARNNLNKTKNMS